MTRHPKRNNPTGEPPSANASSPDQAGTNPQNVSESSAKTAEGIAHTVFGLPLVRVVEIALVVITIPLLSYLAIRVTAIDSTVTNAKLPELATNLAVTNTKVDEIFAQLPFVRMQI